MDVTLELVSLYADGQLSEAEAAVVVEALRSDAALQAGYDELIGLDALFGLGEGEPVSGALAQRLYDVRPVTRLDGFHPVPTTVPRRSRWGGWAVAAAALLMAYVGFQALTHRTPVVLHDFARFELNSIGDVAEVRRAAEVERRAGDVLTASASERVSFRLPDGSMVVLLPGASIELGDRERRDLFRVEDGTVLCTVQDADKPYRVHAGEYALHTYGAHFGVRVENADIRASGPSGGPAPRVTVTVRRGTLEVQNGDTTTVRDYERVVLQEGKAVERGHAAVDPAYRDLVRELSGRLGREIIPGYFASDRGISVVPSNKWERSAGVRTLTVTDAGRGAALAQYLVLYVRAKKETALTLARVRPDPDRPGTAEVVTVTTAPAHSDWTVVSVPVSAFASPDAKRTTRSVRASRTRLVRFELRAADAETTFELKTSLWAEQPPAPVAQATRTLEVDR